MRILHWLAEELKAVVLAGLYFAAFFLLVLLLKRLLLEGYGIAFTAFSTAIVLALVTAKVVVVLDKAPLRHPIGLVEILARTAVYSGLALVLLLVEKAFSSREAAGGFAPALRSILQHPELPQVWATVICVAVAFAGYATFAVIRREVGAERLRAALLGDAASRARELPRR